MAAPYLHVVLQVSNDAVDSQTAMPAAVEPENSTIEDLMSQLNAMH